MQLTGKQIIEQGIITNYTEEAVQQQGVDVRLDRVIRFRTDDSAKPGFVPAHGKTQLREREEILTQYIDGRHSYVLQPGYYEVIVMEGCDMPNNAAMYFRSRSSMVRNGAVVHSGQFDAGFKTDQMGFFLEVNFPIIIERGARIAQTIIIESAPVDEENLYNGQFQGDKQRDPQPEPEKKETKETTESHKGLIEDKKEDKLGTIVTLAKTKEDALLMFNPNNVVENDEPGDDSGDDE